MWIQCSTYHLHGQPRLLICMTIAHSIITFTLLPRHYLLYQPRHYLLSCSRHYLLSRPAISYDKCLPCTQIITTDEDLWIGAEMFGLLTNLFRLANVDFVILGFDSIRVVYAAMFYHVIRCLTRWYIFFHSALSHHSPFNSDCVPTHIVDLWY